MGAPRGEPSTWGLVAGHGPELGMAPSWAWPKWQQQHHTQGTRRCSKHRAQGQHAPAPSPLLLSLGERTREL